MNDWPLIWRIVVLLAAVGLPFLVRIVTRLVDRWSESRAELTDSERAIAANLTRNLYRLDPQPHKLTAGEGCPPTAPSPAVHHKATP